MEIGIGLFTGQRQPTADRSWSDVYDEMTDVVAFADDVGLDSAWVSEHHFSRDGYMPSLLPTLGAFAEATDDIDLGTAMLLAPLHDPVRIAEDAATVSLLSSGRLVLGLANGFREHEFDQFGVDMRERARRTTEAIEIARAAWSEGPLEIDPQFHAIDPDTTVTPKPTTAPTITLGGVAKPAVRRAAIRADGWNAPEHISIDEVRKRVEYQRRLREAERNADDFEVYVHRYCFVADSTEAAWEHLKDPLFTVNRRYAEWETGEEIDALPEERKRLLQDRAIYGTPSAVADRIDEIRAALGDDVNVVLRTYFPGANTDAVRRSIELLGDEVAPTV